MPRLKSWAKNKSYFDLLRDPRWQKKRLEIMHRDSFKCTACHCDNETLNVHHRYYQDGQKPWEYEDVSLVTLCESCHKEEKELLSGERSLLFRCLGIQGYSASQVNSLSCDLLGTSREFGGTEEFLLAFHRFIQSKIKENKLAAKGGCA